MSHTGHADHAHGSTVTAQSWDFRYRVHTFLAVLCIPSLAAVWLPVADPFTGQAGKLWLQHDSVALSCTLSFVCALLGVLVRAAAAGKDGALPDDVVLGRSTRDSTKLVTHGAYAVVRHPLYVGSILLTSALLPLLNTVGAVLFLAMSSYFRARLIRVEEQQLRAQFPDDYEAYVRRVPGLCPSSFRSVREALGSLSLREWLAGLRKQWLFTGLLIGPVLSLWWPSPATFIGCVVAVPLFGRVLLPRRRCRSMELFSGLASVHKHR